MEYYSLHKQSPIVDFAFATVKGQAPDKGLYFLKISPNLTKDFGENLK